MTLIHSADATIAAALNQIDGADWAALLISAAKDIRWKSQIWWHNKYYRANGTNDGSVRQIPRKGVAEIPYTREIFYPSSDSRFSLGADGNVAYFSNDFAVNCCETIEQFSENPALALEDLLKFGHGNPTPGWHGYPLNFHLLPTAKVLDLTSSDSLLLQLMGRDAAGKIWEVITGRDIISKRNTQLIAKAASAAGFDGIVYTSVRAPKDTVMPESNLVMFNKSKVADGAPPRPSDDANGHS